MAFDLAVLPGQRPFGMSGGGCGVHGVRVDPREHAHPQFLAHSDHVAERVDILADALGHAVIGDRRWIESDAAARAEADAIGMDLPEIVDPESGVVAARIIFGKGKLKPAHRFARPIRCAVAPQAARERRVKTRDDRSSPQAQRCPAIKRQDARHEPLL